MESIMNICMFTNTYLPHVGGVANSVALFSEDLQKLGHRVLVVAPVFSDDMEEERGEEILRVPAIQNFNGSDFSMRIAVPFVIANKIREFHPDIIHSHHPYLLGDAALRTARRQNLPLVFTHHTFYEKYTHYVPLHSEGMKRFVIGLSTQYGNLCDWVVAPSRSVGEIIRERGVTTPIAEVPTGTDLEFYAQGKGKRFRQSLHIPSQELVIGHVGRLAPEKNLDYLAESVALFLERQEGTFLVVGAGPSEEKIRRVFQSRGLEGKLVLAGKRTGQELADAYSAMDLFVFASKTETQGMVLVEAMATGMPVIALDAPGVREVVADGQNGRLLDQDAAAFDFADAVHEFVRNPARTKQWKQESLRTAKSYSREKCAGRMAKLYRSAIQAHQGVSWDSEELVPWGKLLRAITAEWELISEKAAASIHTLKGSEKPGHD
jgi:glycosyltransferase involved in cell wall biosynthesis